MEWETRLIVIIAVSGLLMVEEWLATKKDAQRIDEKVGKTGHVRQEITQGQSGLVFVVGELWRATARVEIPKGAEVRVTNVSGLTVHVEPEQNQTQREVAGSSASIPPQLRYHRFAKLR